MKVLGRNPKIGFLIIVIVGPRRVMSPDMRESSADDYYRVQQFRNTSYELRKTEQEEKREKEKEPGNVEEVWKRGYATGFDLTWLFLGLVRAAGFEAYGVYVSDRNNYFFSPAMMDRTRLDTNVVLVKVNGKDLYSDPGAAFTPFGLLIWPETGGRGIAARQGRRYLDQELATTKFRVTNRAQSKPETL